MMYQIKEEIICSIAQRRKHCTLSHNCYPHQCTHYLAFHSQLLSKIMSKIAKEIHCQSAKYGIKAMSTCNNELTVRLREEVGFKCPYGYPHFCPLVVVVWVQCLNDARRGCCSIPDWLSLAI